jgi:hypothetical protein
LEEAILFSSIQTIVKALMGRSQTVAGEKTFIRSGDFELID